MAYHSMNVAAQALGSHASSLVFQRQRFEADIGTQLVDRVHRYQPITLTERGQRLLGHLDEPEVRLLLDRYATPMPAPITEGISPKAGLSAAARSADPAVPGLIVRAGPLVSTFAAPNC